MNMLLLSTSQRSKIVYPRAHNSSVWLVCCTQPSDGDELVEDANWSHTKRGPSLAELLQRVEVSGVFSPGQTLSRSLV